MKKGYFGEFGGCFVPELLMPPLLEVEAAMRDIMPTQQFQDELQDLLHNYAGRPTPLTFCPRLSEELGFELWLKREDLLHSGAHKINNTLGQALLAKYMGKTALVAETGAGQHGVATAVAAARLGMSCTIYMGAEDVERQAPNVMRMRLLGATVHPVESGSRTLKDAINEALRAWIVSQQTTHYCFGTAAGPHPFPTLVRMFQQVIGQEVREQILARAQRLPDAVVKARAKICPQSAGKTRRSKYPVSCNAITQKGGLPRLFFPCLAHRYIHYIWLHLPQPLSADLVVGRSQFHAYETAAGLQAGHAGAPCSHERIQHSAAGRRHLQQLSQQGHRFGRQMGFVSVHAILETARKAALVCCRKHPFAGKKHELTLLPEPPFLRTARPFIPCHDPQPRPPRRLDSVRHGGQLSPVCEHQKRRTFPGHTPALRQPELCPGQPAALILGISEKLGVALFRLAILVFFRHSPLAIPQAYAAAGIGRVCEHAVHRGVRELTQELNAIPLPQIYIRHYRATCETCSGHGVPSAPPSQGAPSCAGKSRSV